MNVAVNVVFLLLFASTRTVVLAGSSSESSEDRKTSFDPSSQQQQPSFGHSLEVVHKSRDELTSAVVQLTNRTVDSFFKSNQFAFVDLDAPWCVWCKRLEPTWEAFAKQVKKSGLPVGIAHVDCMAESQFCRSQRIMAFPTLRWYEYGEAVSPDYKMDRTVEALMHYAKQKVDNVYGKAGEEDSGEEALMKQEVDSDTAHGEDVEMELEETEEEEEPPIGAAAFNKRFDTDKEDDNQMRQTCDRAGFRYGVDPFSQRGGQEFLDFDKMGGRKPRIAPRCKSASANTRGTYNSYFRPCIFQFHSIPKAKHSRLMKLSTVCSWDNRYTEAGHDGAPLQDYVRAWPDECVGDFQRCYSVSKESEKKIFLKHFCTQSWDIPHSVTHISVNCKKDKQEAQARKAQVGDFDPNDHMRAHLEESRKQHVEKVAVVLAIVALAFCCCWVCLCLTFKFVIAPYLKAIKRSKSDPDLKSLINGKEDEA